MRPIKGGPRRDLALQLDFYFTTREQLDRLGNEDRKAQGTYVQRDGGRERSAAQGAEASKNPNPELQPERVLIPLCLSPLEPSAGPAGSSSSSSAAGPDGGRTRRRQEPIDPPRRPGVRRPHARGEDDILITTKLPRWLTRPPC
ncbi:hypothetical protein ZWY2020_056670 [Hordeum vulgare]|nr:hypothetical protein ZWY2020_056670 [Hordeum vulgare]